MRSTKTAARFATLSLAVLGSIVPLAPALAAGTKTSKERLSKSR